MDNISDPSMLLNDDFIEDYSEDSDEPSKSAPLREQDRFLPIANIAKIMKRAIPDNGKIAKDARECIQECVSEFISFITSEASERCHNEKRKTINGEDILYAMCTLGFDNYVEPLTLYLHKYRETTKSDRAVGNASADSRTSEFNQLNVQSNNTSSTTSNNIVTSNTNDNSSGTNTGMVLGQICDSILYYQNDQNQSFQL